VLVHALVKAGQCDYAKEQVEKIVEHTSPENRLVPPQN